MTHRNKQVLMPLQFSDSQYSSVIGRNTLNKPKTPKFISKSLFTFLVLVYFVTFLFCSNSSKTIQYLSQCLCKKCGFIFTSQCLKKILVRTTWILFTNSKYYFFVNPTNWLKTTVSTTVFEDECISNSLLDKTPSLVIKIHMLTLY